MAIKRNPSTGAYGYPNKNAASEVVALIRTG